MAETIAPPTPGPLDGELGMIREYVVLGEQIKALTTRRDELKTTLSEVVQTRGESDGGGHQYLPLPTTVGGYSGFQRQRRVSRTYDEQAAMEILSSAGLKDRCVHQVETLDQDMVMQLLTEGDLTEEHIDKMFPPKVTYALVPVK